MAYATLNGLDVLHCRLSVPFFGLWHADVTLDAATDIAGPQTLAIAGVPWTCAYYRAIDFSGRRGARLIAGRGGWRTEIPAKQYGALPPSVIAVLSDAAAACGELPPVVDPSLPPYVGAAYLRPAGRASVVLQEVLGDGWWADMAGVIQTRPRASAAVVSPFQAIDVDGATGWYDIATETPNDWQPGLTFASPTVSGTVSRVEYAIDPDKVRVRVLIP